MNDTKKVYRQTNKANKYFVSFSKCFANNITQTLDVICRPVADYKT